MRIGLFTAAQWSSDENPAAVLNALREQVRAARDNGFSSLFMGQHLLTGPMGMFQTNPLLGHLVEDAAGMQIGPGVLLLSMMNPVLAAEEAATLDWLSDGNYVLGAGLGYRPEEFQAMGVDKRERVGRLIEGLELIKRLWTEGGVTHHGKYFQLDDEGERQAQAAPATTDLARRRRRAGRAQSGAHRRCVVHRTDAVYPVRTGPPGDLSRRTRRKTGQPEDVSCPLIRECFVGRDAAHAAAASGGPLLFKYRTYASWGQRDTGSDFDAAAFDDFAKGRFLIGEAEQVKDEILHCAETARTDHILLRVQWPGLAHEEALGNIERIGRIIAALS